jgi:ATP-binding cassette subfamily B protein
MSPFEQKEGVLFSVLSEQVFLFGLECQRCTMGMIHPQNRKPLNMTSEKETLSTAWTQLWYYVWPRDQIFLRRKIYWAVVFLVLAKLVTVLIPYSFKWTTEAMMMRSGDQAKTAFLAMPVIFILLYGALRLMMIGFVYVRDCLFAPAVARATHRIARDSFAHIHDLSLRFHIERRTGALARILDRGQSGIEDLARLIIIYLVPTVLEIILVAGVMFYQFNFVYALVSLVMIGTYIYVTKKITDYRTQIRKTMNRAETEAGARAIDSLLNYETVKYFNAEDHEIHRYDLSLEAYEHANVKTYTSVALLNMVQGLILTLGLVCVAIMSFYESTDPIQGAGNLVLINGLFLQLAQPLNFMGSLYREIREALVNTRDLLRLLSMPSEIGNAQEAVPLRVESGELEFAHVDFSYTPHRPLLQDVNFTIEPGRMVGIVGASGSGKSTIARLIFRFYDVMQGAITIDGQNLKNVTLSSLREVVGIVPQDAVLFNDTIGYNIRYGRWHATQDEIREAARQAQIDSFIESLPDGYDTVVGERGLKLSGGEKQRIAIARTLLKNPPFLILDEATSSLDSVTEKDIKNALDVVSQGRTTLVIAHRLSTVIDAHEILVLQKGRIVERGAHDALLKQGGVYAALWQHQNTSSLSL